ncbi:MAG: hypothetical protein U9Q15_02820 [Patescibacteria group bacterium]|nr:hypothetical protein [Patescibacteria group bacterium]
MLVDQQQQLRQIAQSYKNIHQESQKEVLDIINAPTVYTEFLAQADVFLEDYRKKNIAFKQALDSGQEFYMLASAPSFEEKETL